jgi:abequosyltransferase
MDIAMPLKLSICITTLNRAHVIGQTIESIIAQATDGCEIVILDAASTDDTESVVTAYIPRFDRLRYVRQDTNRGIDRDFDRTIELARGEYCWLLSDDDLLKPGAIDTVLHALRRDPSLIVANAEHRNFDMSKVLHRRLFDMDEDQTYFPADLDRLFEDTRRALLVISCIIIKRDIWLARRREPYYGSMFIHVGVIFQNHLPAEAVAIAEPLISHRRGNTHSPSLSPDLGFELMAVKWPALVRSLAISEAVKTAVCDTAQSRSFNALLRWRGAGLYGLSEYRRLLRPELNSAREKLKPMIVGLLPGVLINTLLVLYYLIIPRTRHESYLQSMKESPYHVRNVLRRMF